MFLTQFISAGDVVQRTGMASSPLEKPIRHSMFIDISVSRHDLIPIRLLQRNHTRAPPAHDGRRGWGSPRWHASWSVPETGPR
jgi:hypothetical protein